MTRPAVTVVVPTHDRAATLPRLLRTVLGQTFTDLELVVVDDGSTDDTAAVLAQCTDPRLTTVRHPEALGVSSARNSGTRIASGRYVAWCDDDDVWAPHKLELQLAALEATPGARWCNGGAAHVDADLRLLRTRPCPDPTTVGVDLLRVNVVTGGGSGVLAERGSPSRSAASTLPSPCTRTGTCGLACRKRHPWPSSSCRSSGTSRPSAGCRAAGCTAPWARPSRWRGRSTPWRPVGGCRPSWTATRSVTGCSASRRARVAGSTASCCRTGSTGTASWTSGAPRPAAC